MPLDPPSLITELRNLVDWLELDALFSPFGLSRLDAVISDLQAQFEEHEDDFEVIDRWKEDLINQIETEVSARSDALEAAYPFKLSDDAEELVLQDAWREERFSFYLVCLLTSHITASEIMHFKPDDVLIRRLRNRVFQIVATLAMAGVAGGSAVSVGWPRESGERILDLLIRSAAMGSGISPKAVVSQYTPPREKDGGIDVIAWSGELNPPPSTLWFAQAASGSNWPGKSVADHALVFQANYMDAPRCNVSFATLIPFRVTDPIEWNQQHLYHRSLHDRLRLPRRALDGLRRARAGVPIDEADQMNVVATWLEDYVREALAA